MKLLRIFKLTKLKRIVIFIITTIVALSAIVFGSIFYAAPKTILGPEYHASAQYAIKVSNVGPTDPDTRDLAIKVANDIKARIDGDANNDVRTQAEITVDDDASVRVTYPNVLSDSQRQEIGNLITYKPNLVFTDYYGNALFNSAGAFNSAELTVGTDPGGAVVDPQDVDWDTKSKVPIKTEGVSAIYENQPILKIDWRDEAAQSEWTTIGDYVSKLPEEKRVIIAWLYLNEFIDIAKTQWPTEWENAGHNPYFFAFVNEKPVDDNKKPNILKHFQIDSPHYLISHNIRPNETSLRGESVLLQRPIATSSSDLNHIVRQINYGTASYDLEITSSRFISPEFSSSSFTFFLWAFAIMFVLLTLFLVWNYGIMGIISSLSIALFGFLTWTFLIFLGGIFTPIVVAALVFSVGFFVDKNIVFFEKIKNSLYQRSSLQKSLRTANKKSTPIIFDTHNIALMIGISLFYFGAVTIWGFSLTLVVGMAISLFVLFLFTKMLVLTLLNTGIFDQKSHLLGLKPQLQSSNTATMGVSSIDFVKKSRYVSYGGLVMIGIALIVMMVFMVINFSFVGGLNLSQILRGGSWVEVAGLPGPMTGAQVNDIIAILTANGVNSNEIVQIANGANNNLIDLIRVSVNRDLDLVAIKAAIDSSMFLTYLSTVLSSVGNTLVISAIIGASTALLFIIAYVLFRFKWTFSLTILAIALFDLAIVLSIFIIFRLSLNLEFVIGMLLILIYSMNNNIITFTQIKERTTVHAGVLDRQQNIHIANLSIQTISKRLFYSTVIFVALFALLMVFAHIVTASLAITLFLGVIISAISAIFVGPNLWVKLETFRQKSIENRVKNKYWDINHPEEQTFNGINNYKV